MNRVTKCVVVIGLLIPLTGCEGMGPKEQQYTMAGCATGLLAGLGAGLGLGHGNSGAALAGAGLGMAAGCTTGNIIGRQLDAQDRRAAYAATLAALNAPVTTRPKPQYWNSDHGTGNHGSVIVQATTHAGGKECKQVNEVAYIKGSEVNQPTKYCRDSSGEWGAVST
jgi:surface antigen